MKDIVESIEIRNKVMEDENSELVVELTQNEKIHSENVTEIEKKIQEVQKTNDDLISEIQRLKFDYEAQIAELESQSAFKMKVIHSEKDTRISNYLKKTEVDFNSFEQTTHTNKLISTWLAHDINQQNVATQGSRLLLTTKYQAMQRLWQCMTAKMRDKKTSGE